MIIAHISTFCVVFKRFFIKHNKKLCDIENLSIVNILGTIDDKIENLTSTNKTILELLKKEFVVMYSMLYSNETTSIGNMLSTQISGDWGKDNPESNYSEMVICIRGADIPDFNYCNLNKAPTRYILKRNAETKQLKDYDIIIELSGGSPTQSTGRSAIIPPKFNTIKEKYICTNFCRVLRFDNAKLASYSFLMLNMWYESNLFFNYEIGTTGLKNLNLDAVLSIELKKPTNEFLENVFVNFNNTYNIVQSNAQKIEKLNELKQLYLKKFFK